MGMEDDFLQNDVDDEKTIEYIKNYLPQELKEKFSDDEFYYFLDLIDEYYSESGILDAQPDADGYIEIDLGKIVDYIVKEAHKDEMGDYDPEEILFIVQDGIYGIFGRRIVCIKSIGKSRMSMASSAIFCFYVAGGVFRKKKMDVPMRMTPNTP